MKLSFVILFLLSVNIVSYVLMCMDKWKAKKGFKRIPERILFSTALCFGALGIYLGMKPPVSHKSSKFKFKIGIPLCFILNLLTIYFMEKYVLHISM